MLRRFDNFFNILFLPCSFNEALESCNNFFGRFFQNIEKVCGMHLSKCGRWRGLESNILIKTIQKVCVYATESVSHDQLIYLSLLALRRNYLWDLWWCSLLCSLSHFFSHHLAFRLRRSSRLLYLLSHFVSFLIVIFLSYLYWKFESNIQLTVLDVKKDFVLNI